MLGEPKMDLGGPKTPEEKLTKEQRSELWDDAERYLLALQAKMKGMKQCVVDQEGLPGGMSTEYYLEDISTDAQSLASLLEDLRKNKFPESSEE